MLQAEDAKYLQSYNSAYSLFVADIHTMAIAARLSTEGVKNVLIVKGQHA